MSDRGIAADGPFEKVLKVLKVLSAQARDSRRVMPLGEGPSKPSKPSVTQLLIAMSTSSTGRKSDAGAPPRLPFESLYPSSTIRCLRSKARSVSLAF